MGTESGGDDDDDDDDDELGLSLEATDFIMGTKKLLVFSTVAMVAATAEFAVFSREDKVEERLEGATAVTAAVADCSTVVEMGGDVTAREASAEVIAEATAELAL